MTTGSLLDLDAARREIEHPEGIRVVLRGEEYLLPAELPLDVFDPFLDDSLDLMGVIKDFMSARSDAGDKEDSDWLATLLSRPNLPKQVLNTIHAALAILFGAEDYARFIKSRPSLPDYGRLITGLVKLYGVGLGEAFGSQNSSETAGETVSPTSEENTNSMVGHAIDPRMPAQGTSESEGSTSTFEPFQPTLV